MNAHTATPLQERIKQIQSSIHYLTKALPYADGPQYSIDKRKIADLKRELAYWRTFEQYDKQAA